MRFTFLYIAVWFFYEVIRMEASLLTMIEKIHRIFKSVLELFLIFEKQRDKSIWICGSSEINKITNVLS